jgi:hypothetical protein
MARRPDKREAEMLSEENLNELRRSLAHLNLPAVRDFTNGRTAIAALLPTVFRPPPNADSGPGVEAVVEVALGLVSYNLTHAEASRGMGRGRCSITYCWGKMTHLNGKVLDPWT